MQRRAPPRDRQWSGGHAALLILKSPEFVLSIELRDAQSGVGSKPVRDRDSAQPLLARRSAPLVRASAESRASVEFKELCRSVPPPV